MMNSKKSQLNYSKAYMSIVPIFINMDKRQKSLLKANSKMKLCHLIKPSLQSGFIMTYDNLLKSVRMRYMMLFSIDGTGDKPNITTVLLVFGTLKNSISRILLSLKLLLHLRSVQISKKEEVIVFWFAQLYPSENYHFTKTVLRTRPFVRISNCLPLEGTRLHC